MGKVKKVRRSRGPSVGPYDLPKDCAMADDSVVISAASRSTTTKAPLSDAELAILGAGGKLGRKLSRKEERKLEIQALKEKEAAAILAEEETLPREERTKRELKRRQLDEYRLAKHRVAELKKKRAKLTKRQADSKKQVSKEIKEIMSNLKVKHAAEWKMHELQQPSEGASMEDREVVA